MATAGVGGVGATIPPLRGPTRHNTARKKKSGCSGRDDKQEKANPSRNAEGAEFAEDEKSEEGS